MTTSKEEPVPPVTITGRGVEIDHLAEIDLHPAAELYPPLTDEQFEALYADIAAHGQRDPILATPDGYLLDGRSRYRACKQLGVAPTVKVDEDNPWVVALRANLHRADSLIRTIAVTRLPNRMKGESIDWHNRPPSRKEAAKLLGIGQTSFHRMSVLMENGVDELVQLVLDGTVSLTGGAEVATRPIEAQQEFIDAVRAGVRPRVAMSRPKPVVQASGKGRTHYRRTNLISRDAVLNVVSTLNGMELALRDITEIDPDIGPDEARRLANDLSRGLTRLRNLTKLMKEN